MMPFRPFASSRRATIAGCVAAFAAFAALASLAACTPRPAAETPSRQPSGERVSPVADTAYSVYELASTWRDQRGRERTLSSLRGRPQLVAMVYTHCSTTCPITVDQMKRIEHESDDVGLVLVSLDPSHDSPHRLAEYARERGLDAERWTILTGEAGDVRELAATLGVRYRRISPEEFAHSNTVTLLDASGTPVYQGAGPRTDADIIDALRQIAR
jgi:protein SCO1/2